MFYKSMMAITASLFLIGCGGGEKRPGGDDKVDPDETENTIINLLAVYTDSAEPASGNDVEARIIHNLTVTNKIFEDSKTNVEIVLKDIKKMSISENKSFEEFLIFTAESAQIKEYRDNAGADLVISYRAYRPTDKICGLGFINSTLNPSYGYSAVAIDCDSSTDAHEIGHNFGLSHSHKQLANDGGGIFPYSLGYGVENEFTTIMAYPSSYHAKISYLVFSNPNLSCGGEACGVDVGYNGQAYAAKSIIEVKEDVSNFR